MCHQMLSTGIPELQRKEDINYLRDALQHDSDAEAAEFFKDLIKVSVKTTRTQLNDMAHILKHR